VAASVLSADTERDLCFDAPVLDELLPELPQPATDSATTIAANENSRTTPSRILRIAGRNRNAQALQFITETSR
jgi:hypothetical protein